MCAHTKPNHRAPVTLVILATFLLVATAASAQTTGTKTNDVTKNFSGTQVNPCNSDTIPFTGTFHQMDNTRVQQDGTIFTNFLLQVNGKGVGDPSGVNYTIGSRIKVNGKFPPGPVIIRQRDKVVSNGPTDNFFDTTFVKINQDGTFDDPRFEADCRG